MPRSSRTCTPLQAQAQTSRSARKKGLEPLANLLLLNPMAQPEKQAERFVTDEVENVDAALQGARDILAERFNEDERTRQRCAARSRFRA